LADQDQVDTQIVVAVGRVFFVISAFLIGDRLFKVVDAFLRSLQKPAGTGHVRVCPAQNVCGGMISNERESLFEVFETRLVIAFLYVGNPNPKVRLRQAAPFTTLPKILKRSLRVVASNWVFADCSVSSRQG